MAPAAVNNAMLSDLLQTGKFSDCTIVCQGKEFKLHKIIVCAQSSVIAATLEKASRMRHTRASQSSSLHITSLDLATVECMVDFLYRQDYVINGDALHKARPSGWAGPPNMQVNGSGNRMPATPPPNLSLPQSAMRDILLCHVEVNAIGYHYKLQKLCDRANKYLDTILCSAFPAEIFPDVAIAAFKSSEDAKLHDLMSSFAIKHVHTLVKTPGFEKINTLANFGFSLLRKTVAKLQENENQLVEIQYQGVRDQESIEKLREELSYFKRHASSVSAERELVIKKNTDLALERDNAQRALDEETKQRNLIKQGYSSEKARTASLLSERDSLQQTLETERKNYATLRSERNSLQQQVQNLTAQRNTLTAQQGIAQGEVEALQDKVDDLLDIVENRNWCRNCANPTLPPPPPQPVMAPPEKSSSFLKVIAFFDFLVKLAATGALFGILVILLRISTHLGDIASGELPLVVRISQRYDSTPIGVVVSQSASSGNFLVDVTNGIGNPVHFKVDD
ncbi:hypothetical protein ACHAPT_007277 [Fusarium lateritium]